MKICNTNDQPLLDSRIHTYMGWSCNDTRKVFYVRFLVVATAPWRRRSACAPGTARGLHVWREQLVSATPPRHRAGGSRGASTRQHQVAGLRSWSGSEQTLPEIRASGTFDVSGSESTLVASTPSRRCRGYLCLGDCSRSSSSYFLVDFPPSFVGDLTIL